MWPQGVFVGSQDGLRSKTSDPLSWELVLRRQSDPEGDQYCAWGVTGQLFDTSGFFNVALYHMLCDMGWGGVGAVGCVPEWILVRGSGGSMPGLSAWRACSLSVSLSAP